MLAEFISQTLGKGTKVYISSPTWPNHFNLMRQAGLVPEVYPYYSAATKSFDFKAMSAFVSNAPNGSVFLLHACAHNPTGTNLRDHPVISFLLLRHLFEFPFLSRLLTLLS